VPSAQRAKEQPCCLPCGDLWYALLVPWRHLRQRRRGKLAQAPAAPGYREIPHGDFPWVRMERVGCAANVYRGDMPGFTGGEQVAIKVLQPAADRPPITLEDFRRGVSNLARCSHPNIIRLLAVSCDSTFCLVMPLMREGSLQQLLQSSSYPCASVRVRYARDVFGGLSYLHGARPVITHRNIKASNVFLSGDRALLSDVGVYPLRAPELRWDESRDVYNAGVVLLQLLSWRHSSKRALLDRDRPPGEVADKNIPWPAEVPGVLHREALECTEACPETRPNSDVVRGRLTNLDAYLTRDECLICAERPRQVTLHPCRHNVMCLECFCNTNPGHSCPLCRRVVSSTGSAALARLGWALEAKLQLERR